MLPHGIFYAILLLVLHQIYILQGNMSPIFMQFTGQNNGGIMAVQHFYWPENAIDWPEPA